MRLFRSGSLLGSPHALRYGASAAILAVSLFSVSCIPPGNVSESCSVTINSNGSTSEKCSVTVKDPPGSYLCDTNASQALLNYSLSNATVASTSGTFSLAVSDATTGATLGQNSFGYTVEGNSVYPQNPTALENWLGQFCSYSDVNVSAQVPTELQTTNYGYASATSAAQYQGTTYASATNSWDYPAPKGKPCQPGPCKLGPGSGGK